VVELRILGTLQLGASDGRDLETLARQSKRTALLIYLAAAVPNGLHRRDTLLALFWPELDETHARASLSQALYVLRNELGEQAIVTRGDGEVGLSRDVVWCDARAFEAALDAGQPAEALALYRGALLDGFFLSDVPEFERWLERERDRLRERAAVGGWALAEASAAAGDVFEAERWARWAAALAPADEAVIRRLMTFLRGQGDRAAALRAYAAYTLTLKQEYELEPSAETRALAEAIRLERPLTSADVPIQLPPVSGRGAEPRPRRTPRGRVIAAAAIGALFITAGWWGFHAAGARPAPIHRLAVLPLENLTGDTTQAYFVEGIHDALVTELAKISALSVISRTSVLGYRHTTKTAPEIARELHVDAVVEGSVVLSGDSVRITAQLIAGPTDRHLWADTFVKSRRHVLALYADVAQAIAREVRAAVTPEERARLSHTRPIDPEANDLYLKGHYFCEKWTEEAMTRGIAFYHRAIDRDPTFAPAYAGLAACYADFAFFSFGPPTEIQPRAKAAAQRALEIDSTIGEAHATLGWIRFVTDLDFDGPDQDFRRALALSPGSSWIRSWYADYLALAGRFDDGIAQKRRAIELDPLSVNTSLGLGWMYFKARRYDEAIAQLQRTMELEPGYLYAHMEIAWAYLQKGMPDAAVAHCDSALARVPQLDNQVVLGSCGWVYGRAGRRRQAEKMLRRLTAISPRHSLDPVNLSAVYVGLGDQERALEWLRNAARGHSPGLVFLKVDPFFDPLRSDPRFKALLRELGIES
jgi:DNA-binding SARP family transcriptional activator/TolB-like protein/Tfp pilus assembly protein PilF